MDFQVVEEYHDGYWSVFRHLEKQARDDLVGGCRDVFEARMKEERRSHGRAHHEGRPS